jgi:mannose/fructose/N-acetylgalactosamine-specific phosphotransferase system component IIC
VIRDSLGGTWVVLLAAACCLAFPIVLSAGAGAAAWALGLGLPLALATVFVAWVVVRRRRGRR